MRVLENTQLGFISGGLAATPGGGGGGGYDFMYSYEGDGAGGGGAIPSQMCSATQPYGFQQFSTLTSVGVNFEQPLDNLPLFGFPGSLARAMYRTVVKAIF